MWVQVRGGPLAFLSDETLPKFKKRKHPTKGEKKKQRARTKFQASRQPKRGMPQRGKGTTKYGNLHQLHEAYQLKGSERFNPLGEESRLDHVDRCFISLAQ